MNKSIPVDKAGRVVLPKRLRDRFRLKEGDRLEWEVAEGRITLRPSEPAATPLCKERGVWVYRSGQKNDKSIPDLVDEVRNERGAGTTS